MEKSCTIINKTGIKNQCHNYNSLGICYITDCLTCENADYCIIDHNGNFLLGKNGTYVSWDTNTYEVMNVNVYEVS